MWLLNSSIGRKVIMSLTGICLILFMTFHASMNIVALISGEGYNTICEMLGANWYAVVATVALAVLAMLHFVFAFWLTILNRKARGTQKYDITAKPDKVEWASQNMLVLGIIVLLGIILHLFNFWYNMMYTELLGNDINALGLDTADGFGLMKEVFTNPIFVVLYIIWFVALWMHLTHGFWSAMQTLGWNGKKWFCRWKIIGSLYATILVIAFIVVVLGFFFGIAPSLNTVC